MLEVEKLVQIRIVKQRVQVADRLYDVRDKGPRFQILAVVRTAHVGARSGEHEVIGPKRVLVEVDAHDDVAEEEEVTKALGFAVYDRPRRHTVEVTLTETELEIGTAESEVEIFAGLAASGGAGGDKVIGTAKHKVPVRRWLRRRGWSTRGFW